MKTEKTVVSYTVQAELSDYDVLHVLEIANRCGWAVAEWALRKCVPGMSVSAAFDFVRDIMDNRQTTGV